MTHKPIPGPERSFPFGSAAEFSKNPPVFLNRLANEYGEMARFYIFGRSLYVVSNPDYVREILVSKADIFPKAERDKAILGKFLGNGLLTSGGDFHKQQRKLVQPAFHRQRIQNYAETMVNYTENVLDGWRDGETRHIDDDMMTLTMFIVAKTLFDADMDEMAGSTERIGHAIEDLQMTSNAEYKRPFNWPEWVPTPNNRLRKKGRAIVYGAIDKLIAERRATAVNGRVADTGDLLSMLLLAQDEDGQLMPDNQVRDELVTLFAAGHETTSNALAWTWYLLSQHPEVEAKLHREVDEVLNGRSPTLADLPKLPYTEMVLKESMRLYPPAWIVSARQAVEDVELGDYLIPKDKLVMVSPYVIHRRPEYFPDPEQFDPERFSPENEKNLPRYAYIPFGAGPRVCIGNSFAMMEGHLILAAIAQRFRLELDPNQEIELNPLITLSPKYGLKMRVIKREPATGSEPMETPGETHYQDKVALPA
ncbi:MAG: cytochrome P450 [Candidatus Promineifilaceae bacterium]